MEISRCLIGNTPYITNQKVYDAGALQNGELMMYNATAISSGAPNSGAVNYFITAAANTAAEAVDVIGALQCSSRQGYEDKLNNAISAAAMKIGSDYYADAASTAGWNFLPIAISPEVLWMADFYQVNDSDATDNPIADTVTASTGTAVTIANLQDHLDGGFLYTTKESSTTADYPGQLRFISSSTGTGACILTTAMNLGANSDVILILPSLINRLGLTDDGVGLSSITDKTGDDCSVGLTTSIVVWETWGRWESAPWHPLRKWTDDGIDGISRSTFAAELLMQDHFLMKPAT